MVVITESELYSNIVVLRVRAERRISAAGSQGGFAGNCTHIIHSGAAFFTIVTRRLAWVLRVTCSCFKGPSCAYPLHGAFGQVRCGDLRARLKVTEQFPQRSGDKVGICERRKVVAGLVYDGPAKLLRLGGLADVCLAQP
jgi:hypothetical protein